MAVEAFVALMVDKLGELLRNQEAPLLGLLGEIEHIQDGLKKMLPFLQDADIKQKENEDVRDWMEDIRDICFDVDDVIDILLGQGQAAQGRHGFVERLKRCISNQFTRYKVGFEINQIKLNIKGISRSRESYGIREINEASTQRLQEVERRPILTEKIEIVIPTVDDQLTNEERTEDIDGGRQKAIYSSQNLEEQRRVSTLPGEPEEVGLQEEINTGGQQLIEEEPRLWDGTREGKLEASSSTLSLKSDTRFSTRSFTPFMASTKKITLKSSDGKTFAVDEAVALQSQTIKDMIEDDCARIPNVTGKILAKVIEYCEKHVEMPEDADDRATEDELKAWDTEFVKVDQAVLFDLINAAYYLNIESLVDLTCQTAADRMEVKIPDGNRIKFNIKNDFTMKKRRRHGWKNSGTTIK